MTPARFAETALALPGTVLDLKWGGLQVFTVAGKMFAHAGRVGEPAPRYAFKASPTAYALLIESGEATPAPYFARLGWVRLASSDVLQDADLARYVALAHGLAARTLTVKARQTLGLPV